MGRSRRSSSPSYSDDSFSSADDRRRPPTHRSLRRPSSYQQNEHRSLRSLEKGGRRPVNWDDWPPRYEEDWSTDSGGTWSSGASSDTDDSRDSSRTRFSSASAAPAPTTQQKQQTRRCLILFFGVSVAILLVLLGAFALVKYFGPDSAASSGLTTPVEEKIVTVTVTEPDGHIATKVSTSSSTASKTASAKDSEGTGSSEENTSGNSAGSSAGSNKLPGLSRNNIGIGFLPDYNDQNMKDITDGLGIKSSFYGWYAQLPESGEWDGSQLLSQLEDVMACNCIFQPAVMPTKGWNGLTKDDNYQALAIAKVMKKFTDEGIEVWLRFAHEINWYLTDGTYQGTAADFKEAWPVVAEAVADNDLVKMFFTPNIAGKLQDYLDVTPDDRSTIDYFGIDYYPRKVSESFVDTLKEVYDEFCSDGKIKFAMGETGTMWVATIEERLAWMDELTSAGTAKAFPHYVGIAWFNYNKEQQFKLWMKEDESVNQKSKAWFAEGTVAEGAPMGNG
ncbi:hypothetical protein JCM11251_000822 [Rhodosporidiobolus azoricus]